MVDVFGQQGEVALRQENINALVKGFGLQEFVMKDVFSIENSQSWDESYYRESATELTAAQRIPRGGAFPHAEVEWRKFTSTMAKAGLESSITWEDAISNNVDVIKRTLLRVSRAVAKIKNDAIYTEITTNNGLTAAALATWDNATRGNRHPQDDVGAAIQSLSENNYVADTLLVTPKDFNLLVTNDDTLDAFAPNDNIMRTGNLGTFLGLKLIVSNSVTADEAAVLESKICGTYKVLEPLKVVKKSEDGIRHIIRAWETGVAYLTDPNAVPVITNTNA